jgi:glycosyl transferase family 25
MDPINFDKIAKHCVYINLDIRTDRRAYVESQLAGIGIHTPIRFSAVHLQSGAIGCSMSHLKCLINAKNHGWPCIMIVEDDITFTNPTLFSSQLSRCLATTKGKWDVILLAGNNYCPYESVDDTCIRVSNCQTTTGYVVQSHYYDALINNVREGMSKLIREETINVNSWLIRDAHAYTIDRYWFSLQRRDVWLLIIPLSVIQLDNYSNVERRHTNYKQVMLTLSKQPYWK